MTEIVVAYLVGVFTGPVWVLLIEAVNRFNTGRTVKALNRERAARRKEITEQEWQEWEGTL